MEEEETEEGQRGRQRGETEERQRGETEERQRRETEGRDGGETEGETDDRYNDEGVPVPLQLSRTLEQ